MLPRADLFPDALAGAPLAIQEEAPLPLTPVDELAPGVAAEIARVLPAGGTVYLLGGVAALDQSVQDAVQALGFTTVRYFGANRFSTAVAITSEGLGDPATLLLASGNDFPDALAAGAAAGNADGAVVLTAGASLPAETAAYLDSRPATTRLATSGTFADALAAVWTWGGVAGRSC